MYYVEAVLKRDVNSEMIECSSQDTKGRSMIRKYIGVGLGYMGNFVKIEASSVVSM